MFPTLSLQQNEAKTFVDLGRRLYSAVSRETTFGACGILLQLQLSIMRFFSLGSLRNKLNLIM